MVEERARCAGRNDKGNRSRISAIVRHARVIRRSRPCCCRGLDIEGMARSVHREHIGTSATQRERRVRHHIDHVGRHSVVHHAECTWRVTSHPCVRMKGSPAHPHHHPTHSGSSAGAHHHSAHCHPPTCPHLAACFGHSSHSHNAACAHHPAHRHGTARSHHPAHRRGTARSHHPSASHCPAAPRRATHFRHAAGSRHPARHRHSTHARCSSLP